MDKNNLKIVILEIIKTPPNTYIFERFGVVILIFQNFVFLANSRIMKMR